MELKVFKKVEDKDCKAAQFFGQTKSNGEPIDVYHLQKCIHSYRSDKEWACPAGEPPTPENMIPFDGRRCLWGLEVRESNYLKSSGMSGDEYRKGLSCVITLDGEPIHQVTSGRDILTALPFAQVALVKLREHCISFHQADWKETLIGRKIYYRGEPAVITSYSEGSMHIKPDGPEYFSPPSYILDDAAQGNKYAISEWQHEYGDGCAVDLLDKDIWWWREQ